jgi:hypothetical protein
MFGCDNLNRTSRKLSSQAQSDGYCTLLMIVSILHMCNLCSDPRLFSLAHLIGVIEGSGTVAVTTVDL